jgi:hypothetical protein
MRGIQLQQAGLSEGEIRHCIEQGGRLRNVFLLARGDSPATEYLAYIRPSWRRGFLPLRTWGNKGDRTYKDVDRLLTLLRDDFGFSGVIQLYVESDPDVPRYRALAEKTPEDRKIITVMAADAPDPSACGSPPDEAD